MVRKEYDFSKATRGAAIPTPGKTRITIMLDADLIELFRARAESEGIGYQTMINATLRAMVTGKLSKAAEDKPLTVAVLRKILREELHQ